MWFAQYIAAWVALAAAGVFAAISGCPGSTPVDWPSERMDNGPTSQPVAVQTAVMDPTGAKAAVAVWRGSSTGMVTTFTPAAGGGWTTTIINSDPLYFAANAIGLADVNQDGYTDVLVADGDTGNGQSVTTPSGTLILSTASIRYLQAPVPPATDWKVLDITASKATATNGNWKQWFDVAAAQLDGINGLDIVATLNDIGRLVWFEAPADPLNADGWVLHSIDSTTRAGADSVLPMDMNGDGLIDVVSSATGDTEGEISWYENPADATARTNPWAKHIMTSFSGATRFAFGDLDGDGLLDMAAVSPGQRQVAWFPHPANVTDAWNGWVLANYAANSSDTRVPFDVAIADMNNDGQLDVVVISNSPASVFYYSPGADNQGTWTEFRVAAVSGVGYGLFSVSDILSRGLNDVIVPVTNDTDANLDQVLRFINPG